MAQQKIHILLWLLAGLLFSFLVFVVILTGFSDRILITNNEIIPETADSIMQAIQAGDWTTLESMVAGNSVLTPATGAEGSAEQIIYYAYQESLRWSFSKPFRIQGSYITQPISVTYLDIPRVTAHMTGIMLQSDNADTALRPVAEQVLVANIPITKQEITLTFLLENGQWKLFPDEALQALLSGFCIL